MSKTKNRVLFVGRGVIALELASTDEATELAMQLADQTGKAITVRDADGVPIATIPGPIRN